VDVVSTRGGGAGGIRGKQYSKKKPRHRGMETGGLAKETKKQKKRGVAAHLKTY